jgi:hypothetical protein
MLYVLGATAKYAAFERPTSAMAHSTCFTPRLSPLNGKPILLGFDGADMSSDAGLTLLREIERKAGLAQRLADCLSIRAIRRKFSIACATSSVSGS